MVGRGELRGEGLASGMKLLVDILQSVLVHMGVDLGGCNIGVAKHHLYRTKIRTMAQQVGGKGVAQHVGGNIFFNTCGESSFFDDLPEAQSCHAGAAIGYEQVVAASSLEDEGPGCFMVVFNFCLGLLTKGDETLLATLAENPDKARSHVTGRKWELDQLRNP